MSWHPSRAAKQGPARSARYRPAVVHSFAGRSLLVETVDGDDRLVPAPPAPWANLVGATVLLADDHEWVVTVEPTDPVERVVVSSR